MVLKIIKVYLWLANRIHLILFLLSILIPITMNSTINQSALGTKTAGITLTNLTLVMLQPHKMHISDKQLKVSAGSVAVATKSQPRSSSDGQLHWDDVLVVPYGDSRRSSGPVSGDKNSDKKETGIFFEITTRHQFGYNPQQLNSVVQGQILIDPKHQMSSSTGSNNGRLITSSVYDQQGKKVGHLKVNFRMGAVSSISGISKNSKIGNSVSPGQKDSSMRQDTKKEKTLVASQLLLPRQSKITSSYQHNIEHTPITLEKTKNGNLIGNSYKAVVVSSVIAHADAVKGKNIRLVLQYGGNKIKTEEFKSKSGEIVFLGRYEIRAAQNNRQNGKGQNLSAEIILDSSESSGNGNIIGKAVFSIDQLGKVNKKGILMGQGRQLGQIFIDGKIFDKNSPQFKNKFRNQPDILASFIHPAKSRNRNEFSPSDPTASHLLHSSLRKSVVNSNTTIKFTKQVRFFNNLHDPKSAHVSYQDPPSLDFKEQRVGRYYRGASIGRGSKYDFTEMGKGRPGVGQYFLPTIWDRY